MKFFAAHASGIKIDKVTKKVMRITTFTREDQRLSEISQKEKYSSEVEERNQNRSNENLDDEKKDIPYLYVCHEEDGADGE